METIKKITGFEIGFSDHTEWIETPLAAATLGAKVIEKHFTFNKKAKGWDHAVSADYNEMKNLVISTKKCFDLSGKLERKLSIEEIKKSKIMRRSITIKKDLNKNQRITIKDIDLQRPGTGIAPKDLKKIVNKVTKKDLKKGEILKWNEIR